MLKSVNSILLLITCFSQDKKLGSYILKLKKIFSGGELEKCVIIFFPYDS